VSQTTEICLVRHGETEWNRNGRYQGTSDIPLNDLGIEQARLAAIRLAGERWDAVISSPLSRAKATAQAIADAIGIEPIEMLTDLQERAYGDAEGLTIAEREERWPEGEWPNLESVEATWARGANVLKHVVANHPGKRVIVVSHGGLINAILHVVSDGELGTGVTRILNVSLTRLHSDDDGVSWTVDVVSDADHLLDEHGVLNVLMPAAVDTSGLAAARSGT
jgi:uncharacterized phosphatase